MKRIQHFALLEPDAPDAAKARLVVRGSPSNIQVDGINLVDQFEIEDGYLVVTDFNDPWEELTVVSLLNSDLRLIAKKLLGKAGISTFVAKTFSVKTIEPTGARELLAIGFQDDQGSYKIQVADKQKWSRFRNPIRIEWLPPAAHSAPQGPQSE